MTSLQTDTHFKNRCSNVQTVSKLRFCSIKLTYKKLLMINIAIFLIIRPNKSDSKSEKALLASTIDNHHQITGILIQPNLIQY